MRRLPRLAPRAVAPAALLVASLSLPVAGCGQKGPLVLPDTDASGVVIRDAGGVEAAPVAQPERRERRSPAVPAPTQAPSETAPRSTTPR
jgi:predicted small lipoprotein YifL